MHRGKVQDLFLISPDFPWSEFLELTFGRPIPKSQSIIYIEAKYLAEFTQLINTTEKRHGF